MSSAHSPLKSDIFLLQTISRQFWLQFLLRHICPAASPSSCYQLTASALATVHSYDSPITLQKNNPTNQSSFAMCPALGGPIGCILDVSVFTAIVLIRLVKSSSLIICFDICKQKYFIFYQQRNILIKHNKASLFVFAQKTGTSFKCGSNYAHVTSRHVTVRKFYIYTGVVIRCSSYNWTRSTACGICISGAV